jgi:hypothetical protein
MTTSAKGKQSIIRWRPNNREMEKAMLLFERLSNINFRSHGKSSSGVHGCQNIK